MCRFITLIVPSAEADAVRGMMEQHGRTAAPLDNPSVRRVLREGERQYLTTRRHCDCGTVLAQRYDSAQAAEEKIARDIHRWKRKGWSDAKIARAIEDQRRADARPSGGDVDSIELWNAILADLGKALHLPYAGLFLRFYSSAISTEVFDATRREIRKDMSRLEALGSMRHDEVTIFPLA
ncbi:hypothetical protein FHS96_001285 [Sphingomonas zeicaulis]|uniref:hypothetical protein n=1 Tax=Sphingomonas zeicaulis TaxID=1632740 RepID=UPI003D1BF9A3